MRAVSSVMREFRLGSVRALATSGTGGAETLYSHPSETGPSLGASLVCGACAGVCASAVVTWIRANTWVPYAPVMLPYDVIAITGAALFAFGGAAAVGRVVRSATVFPHHVAVLGLAGLLWREGLGSVATPPGVVGATICLWLIAAVLLVLRGGATSSRRLPFPGYVGLAWIGLAASLRSSPPTDLESMILPALMVAAAVLGVRPFSGRATEIGVAATIAALGFLAFSALAPSPLDPHEPNRPAVEVANQSRRSVVLIVLDNLRRDHMSLYGSPRQTTPHLDEWSKRALVFHHAIATSGWTLPSHASMFTGMYPRSHGAHGYASERDGQSTYVLRQDVRTLAEVASDAGVITGAVVANHFLLGPEFGIDQGFMDYQLLHPNPGLRLRRLDEAVLNHDRYRYTAIDWPYVRGAFVTDLAMKWLADHDDESHFLFVNYMDVHLPNDQPGNDVLPFDDEIIVPRWFLEGRKVLEHQKLSSDVLRSLVNSYDRELMALDVHVGRLIEFIEASRSGSDTVILVTSDHGEYFGEHDLINHMIHVYAEETNVPLLLAGPDIRIGHSDARVQSVDVYDTVLEALGVAVPAASQGQSLLRPTSRPQVAEWYSAPLGWMRDPRYNGRFMEDVIGYQDGSLRLIAYQGGRSELYDVTLDPYETHDLAASQPDDVARLRAALTAWQSSHGTPENLEPVSDSAKPLNDMLLEQLRSLGYAQ